MKHQIEIERLEDQAAMEQAEEAALIERALKREFPSQWLAKTFRVCGVAKARQERLRNMLAQRVEMVDMATAEGGLSHGCFTAAQA